MIVDGAAATGAPTIESMRETDWSAVLAIYAEGVATGDATLETEVPDGPAWDGDHLAAPRLVARAAEAVVGWTALSAVSDRCAYEGVAWESVYVAAAARGRGVGRALIEAMIGASEAAGIWTLQAGILVENLASLVLHEHAGFRRVGVRERMGRDGAGRWRDVVLLERRSAVVGVGPDGGGERRPGAA